MNSERDFLEALLDDPADDVLRLAFADWLEESGDRRGQFLRVLVPLEERYQYQRRTLGRWDAVERASGQPLVLILPPNDDRSWQKEIWKVAALLARLDHPRLQRLSDLGITGDGRVYYVLPPLVGVELTAAWRGSPAAGDATFRSPRRLVRLVLDVCRGVAAAHHRGVMHGDIFPAHVWLGPGGDVTVTGWEYGGCRDFDELDEARLCSVAGHHLYIAPERIRGEPLSVQTDVYGLGGLLYEALYGRAPNALPGQASAIDILQRALEEPRRPGRLREDLVPAGDSPRAAFAAVMSLEMTCLKALAYEPARRHGHVGELALELETWLAAYSSLWDDR